MAYSLTLDFLRHRKRCGSQLNVREAVARCVMICYTWSSRNPRRRRRAGGPQPSSERRQHNVCFVHSSAPHSSCHGGPHSCHSAGGGGRAARRGRSGEGGGAGLRGGAGVLPCAAAHARRLAARRPLHAGAGLLLLRLLSPRRRVARRAPACVAAASRSAVRRRFRALQPWPRRASRRRASQAPHRAPSSRPSTCVRPPQTPARATTPRE